MFREPTHHCSMRNTEHRDHELAHCSFRAHVELSATGGAPGLLLALTS